MRALNNCCYFIREEKADTGSGLEEKIIHTNHTVYTRITSHDPYATTLSRVPEIHNTSVARIPINFG